MTNDEWLKSLEPAELKAWFDAEHDEDELRFADECRDPGVTGWWPDERDCMEEAAEAPSDSREKLEAEMRKWCGMYQYQVDMVWVWLNRQAAITRRELQDEVDRFKRQNVALARDLGECMAERDELRAAYGDLTAIAADLCRACGFSMVDASGEVV